MNNLKERTLTKNEERNVKSLGEDVRPKSDPLIPRQIVSATALVCAGALIVIGLLGPLGIGAIQHKTSPSGIWQTMGQDLTGLMLITPILLVGGVLHLIRKDSSKYFLILPPITLIFTGLSYGIGQEWSNAAYTGNVETYSLLYLSLVVGGLILLVSSLSMFTNEDTPAFNRRSLRIYVGMMTVFLALFAVMWVSELSQVIALGNTASGAYQTAPTAWWVTRFLDLGITIPLGFMALSLLLSKPERAYSLVLLFFGFFITLGTAVNAMGWVQFVNGDAEFQPISLVIFSMLGVLSYAGLIYLVKNKLPWFAAK